MKRPLVCIAGGFVLGEVLTLLPVAYMAVIPAVLTVGVYCLWRSGRAGMIWLMPLFCVFGIFRMEYDQKQMTAYEKTAENVMDREIWLKGTVAGIRKQSGGEGIILELKAPKLELEGESSCFGNVLVYLDELPRDCLPGTDVAVRGKLERFQSPGNPGEFDYNAYYHALGIEGRMYGESLEVTDTGYSPYFWAIYNAKQYAGNILESICTEEDQGIFKAVVLGEKSELSPAIRNLYASNGIAHLLAVSGLHISMMGLGAYEIFRKMGMGFLGAFLLGTASTVSYGVMTCGAGISSSVYRAVLMVLLKMAADVLGRTYDMMSAAAMAALLLLFMSPALLFQSGFQLSFGAVAALAVVEPLLEEWLGTDCSDKAADDGKMVAAEIGKAAADDGKIGQAAEGMRKAAADDGKIGKAAAGMRKAAAAGIAIQIVTCPVVLYHYFEYPIYGIVLNLVVIPLMTYVLLSGVLGIVFGAFSKTAGMMAVGTGHYVLQFYSRACAVCQKLPGAVQVPGRPQLWSLVLYTVLWTAALAVIYGKRQRNTKKAEGKKSWSDGNVRRYAVAACFVLVTFDLLFFPRYRKGMEVTFLDVGQGDGICIETRDCVILVDGGSSDRKKLADQVLEPFLKSRGIRKIDYVVISHGDQDHISGVMELLESDCGIEAECLVLPWLAGEKRQEKDENYEKLLHLAEEKSITVMWMKQGDILPESGNYLEPLRLVCLYAGDKERWSDRNEHSLLIEVCYGRAGILLTGDMSAEGERRWIENMEHVSEEEKSRMPGWGLPKVQVLKTAHHGSSYSTCEEFLDEVEPVWAVISCGRKNRYGHPSPETMGRLKDHGAECLLTMDCGAVIFCTDGKTASIDSFRKVSIDSFGKDD